MKTLLHLFVFALLLIPTTFVIAQTDSVPAQAPPPAEKEAPAKSDENKKLYKGIRFGYQSSNFSNSDWGDLTSFYAGIFAVKKLGAGKLLSLYTGLEYYQTGASEDDNNEIILGYISLPINLRVQIGPVYAFGGFNPSFKISEDVTIAGQDPGDAFDINGFDVGGQIGLGAKFLFLGAEVKYNKGLISVFDSVNGDENMTEHLQAGLCLYF